MALTKATSEVLDISGLSIALAGDATVGGISTVYATKASAALTGTPTAPTPATADNSTKIATTSYVVSKIAATNINTLSDVVITSAVVGQTLVFNGTNWVNQNATAAGSTTATPNTVAQRDANADIYSNNFISTSDQALKTNIKPLANALETVSQLIGHEYTFINTGETSYGVIAQEIEQILPLIVSVDSNNGYKSVNYLALIAFLIEAIKQLKTEVDELKTEVDELKK